MKYQKINDEVLYTRDVIPRMDQAEMNVLKKESLKSPRKRIRVCTHQGEQDTFQEMLIIHAKDAYVPPHKHIGKIESLHVMEGLADVFIFDESGNVREVFSVGDYASGRSFYFRMPENVFHNLIIKSEFLVFHEATLGPFKREASVFADWAPKEGEHHEYLRTLEQVAEGMAIKV